jgi:hypothetical protein
MSKHLITWRRLRRDRELKEAEDQKKIAKEKEKMSCAALLRRLGVWKS